MSGKFLPYKYYGNEQGIQEYGLKGAEASEASGHTCKQRSSRRGDPGR